MQLRWWRLASPSKQAFYARHSRWVALPYASGPAFTFIVVRLRSCCVLKNYVMVIIVLRFPAVAPDLGAAGAGGHGRHARGGTAEGARRE
jgi:hypothetical protein